MMDNILTYPEEETEGHLRPNGYAVVYIYQEIQRKGISVYKSPPPPPNLLLPPMLPNGIDQHGLGLFSSSLKLTSTLEHPGEQYQSHVLRFTLFPRLPSYSTDTVIIWTFIFNRMPSNDTFCQMALDSWKAHIHTLDQNQINDK